jgi:diguanylate cyclase (GGDEF)-like protein
MLLRRTRLSRRVQPARRKSRGVFIFLLTLFALPAWAADQDVRAQLRLADQVKTSDYPQFIEIIESVSKDLEQLSPQNQQYVLYLQSWGKAYDGEYEAAIDGLRDLLDRVEDPVLQLRARATMANVLSIATNYNEAFAILTTMLGSLNEVPDPDAREQALGVAALLYNQVEQYSLGLEYAQMLIKEDWQGRGTCKGGQLRFEALSRSGQLANHLQDAEAAVHACSAIGEFVRANLIRTYIAKWYVEHNRLEDALTLLNAHHAEVAATRYPLLISEFDALRALVAHRLGRPQEAKASAKNAITNGVQNQYTEPLVTAYRVLYEIARVEGDTAAALEYHEKFSAADKGYLDDISARQIAYEKVKHEMLARQLEIDALNKQNEILQLERENNRLYIALLISILAFIALWAYKTKRLQMHFMRLSQRDGLTGIANRPHFISRAEHLLDVSRKSNQELCVVLTDLDYFKAINDRFGHAAGDFVLKRTVEVCQSHMRPQDLFGRFGGEEFGIVLAGCELAVARERCEQLRLAVESVTAPEYGMHSNITASFGVAAARHSGYDLRTLLAHADAALYQAKREGRNCVIAYEPQRDSNALPEQSSRRAGVA